MSRTFKKNIRCFVCCGSNTEYYRARRRKVRRRCNHQLRTLMANRLPEDVDDLWTDPCLPKEDQWDEPTDGHWHENLDTLKMNIRIYGPKGLYYADMKQFKYYLKPRVSRFKEKICIFLH